jgi:N-acetylglucosaminyl-diphospho-decaprenol L-rhamnosyltransferase
MDPATLPATSGHSDLDAREPDAAIVVVNYRTPELVERCLRSVRATCGELRLQTVVVDNASGDGSVERLRAALPHATVVAMEENRGFAAGVNAGFRHCAAELVVVLNPDTEVRPGALRALLERLRERPRTGVVAPLLQDAEGQPTASAYRRFPGLFSLAFDLCLPLSYALAYAPGLHPYSLSPKALLAGRPVAHVCGAAMAIRRSAYEQAGPLDEGFFLYLEETEWQQRVAQSGWTIEVLPAARVCHLVRGGGAEALAPSPHFVGGALRYLRLRGVPSVLARAMLSLALALSWVTLRLIALLPAKRARATGQARAYGALLRQALAGATPSPTA